MSILCCSPSSVKVHQSRGGAAFGSFAKLAKLQKESDAYLPFYCPAPAASATEEENWAKVNDTVPQYYITSRVWVYTVQSIEYLNAKQSNESQV